MDESKPPISASEIDLRPASDWKPEVIDAVSTDSTLSKKPVAPGRQHHSDPSEFCGNNPAEAPPVVVYCDNEEEVSRGFLIALRAMGLAVVR